MKSITLIILFTLLATSLLAQTETFDLVTFTPPNDWQKEVTENSITYTVTNNQNNTWCQIRILKSTTSKGTIEEDFESEWQTLIVTNFKPTESRQLNEVVDSDGWRIKAAVVKFTFNNSDALAMLTTASGFQRCTSIVAITNSQEYLKDIEVLISSVVLKKMDIESSSVVGGMTVPAQTNANASSIIGTWGISMGVPFRSGTESIAGTTIKQYTFNTNGTFTFYSKTFKYNYAKLLLIKESGMYQINGNIITINPQNSVMEAWSKKDDTSNWGNLLSTENRSLEKVTYQFTKYYYSGVNKWNLVLQANATTKRDGPYSNNSTFANAWLYSPVEANAILKLPN